MNKLNNLLKVVFHLINLILILFYLYPGSIFGYILYQNFEQQPQITSDFLYISSNHFYAFIILSISGFLAYYNHKKIYLLIGYLFLLSITLELFHLIIPQRGFQLIDLIGNIMGVLIVYIMFEFLKRIKF